MNNRKVKYNQTHSETKILYPMYQKFITISLCYVLSIEIHKNQIQLNHCVIALLVGFFAIIVYFSIEFNFSSTDIRSSAATHL